MQKTVQARERNKYLNTETNMTEARKKIQQEKLRAAAAAAEATSESKGNSKKPGAH